MNQSIETAEIQNKAPKPPGNLPKNVQSWILVGVAFAMVAIMGLTGKKPPTPVQPMPSAAPQQAPLEVNEAKITEMQNRIQDLQRQQLLAQTTLLQQARSVGTSTPDSTAAQQQSVAVTGGQHFEEDPLQAERKRRAYVSLFASNLALSYRKAPLTASSSPTETTLLVPTANSSVADTVGALQLLKGLQAGPATAPQSLSNNSALPDKDRKEESKNPAAPANAATGKTYVLFEGTILETVLLNRLDGSFTGPVECLLSTDVYSHDRQHLLLPAGSKLLGETKKVDAFGQTRLAVVFHRALMPDGYSISLDQFKGLNQIGDTGLRDQVNNHYFRIFGVSLALGALGAVAEGGAAGPLTASGADLMRQGFAQSTAQSSAQILDKFLNVMPTVTIREGHRVKIYLAGDLALPDYLNHKMPSDL